MAEQTGEVSAAPVGQQGQADGNTATQGARPGRGGDRSKAGRGKPAGRRGGKAKEGGGPARQAEVGMRGTGFVKTVKDVFGYISSPELDEPIFFHASEVVRPEGQEATEVPLAQLVAVGDEVEFIVGQNTGKRYNVVAKQVKQLPLHTVKAQLLSEERYVGTVKRELNSGQWRSEDSNNGLISYVETGPGIKPGAEATVEFHAADTRHMRAQLRKGSLVEFNLCTDNHTQQRRAVHIEVKMGQRVAQEGQGGASGQASQLTVLHGFIVAMKPQSGSIRCVERPGRLNFKRADAAAQHQDKLQQGAEVMVSLQGEAVVGVAVLPSGTLVSEQVSPNPVQGRVTKPVTPGEKQEDGLISPVLDLERNTVVSFRAGPLDGSAEDAASLRVEDEVEFTMVTDLKSDTSFARDLRLLCRAADRRELGQIRTLKNNFGFIRCCQRSGDLFFHCSELERCSKDELAKGDDVEFTVARNPEHGTVAVRVRKLPPGSAIFETISEQEYVGVVRTPVQNQGPAASSSGVIAFEENGQPAKILFGENDMKERVFTGDHVTFRIANSAAAAKQAEKLGSSVSKLVGRRATKGALLKVAGTVRQAKPSYGFIKYTPSGGGGERSAFFHASEVRNEAALKPGDEVLCTLWLNTKTKEVNARRIIRTKEAPAATQEDAAPAAPQQAKFGGNATAVPTVRMAAMPDGTRGFHMGRGGALAAPSGPPKGMLVGQQSPMRKQLELHASQSVQEFV